MSHDVCKFFNLLLKRNGYVLEQLFSPLIVHTTSEHAELRSICLPPSGRLLASSQHGSGVITKHPSHHYFGFAVDADLGLYDSEYQRLRTELQAAHEASRLQEAPSAATRAALNDLLVRVRVQSARVGPDLIRNTATSRVAPP